MRLWLLPVVVLIAMAPLHATTILQCDINGTGWITGSGCASNTVFNNLASAIDWGAPTSAGAWAAHPLEAGLGTAVGNTHDATLNDWQAIGSDGTNIGLGLGAAAASGVLVRTDNALRAYDPTEFGGTHWGNLAPVGTYYDGYSFFGGHGNSGPINALDGNFNAVTNTTDQFYSGPYFYSHGTPNTTAGTSSTAVPWVGDHLVGFNSPTDQKMKVTFNNGGQGVDEVAFSILGRSDSQTNNQSTVSSLWTSGGSNPSGIMEILVQAYDNIDPSLGTLLYSYEILVGGTTPGFGGCTIARDGVGLNSSVPVPCNDAPIIDIQGTKGVFNIKSIVISSSTDSVGFYIDELHYDQAGASIPTDTPEPAQMFLIGGGLILTGVLAKRRGLVRR
jgi:hypothetical protein